MMAEYDWIKALTKVSPQSQPEAGSSACNQEESNEMKSITMQNNLIYICGKIYQN